MLMEHDLFGKPVSTFPDHALGKAGLDAFRRIFVVLYWHFLSQRVSVPPFAVFPATMFFWPAYGPLNGPDSISRIRLPSIRVTKCMRQSFIWAFALSVINISIPTSFVVTSFALSTNAAYERTVRLFI
jgi:hypothetical protein